MKNPAEFLNKLDTLAQEWNVSALVQMADAEGPIARRAYGTADSTGRPLSEQDRFCISAHDLFFLSLCVLHLVEQGVLRLNMHVSDWIPEYTQGKKITLAHLMRMDSGIPDDLYAHRLPALQKEAAHNALSDEDRFRREYEFKAADCPFAEVLARLQGEELTHTPGTEEDYSTSSAAFLSEIIQRAAGMQPVDYLLTRVFAPLHLTDTRAGNDSTVAYWGCMAEKIPVSLPRIAPAHCFTTTLSDMHTLARSIVEERLISHALLQTALKARHEGAACGFVQAGEICFAETAPNYCGTWLRLYFCFSEKMTWVMLNNRDFQVIQRDNHWEAFPPLVRRHWQYSRTRPKQPEFVKVTGKNVWDALDMEITQQQRSFVPDARTCIAVSMARRYATYMLRENGLSIGLAALEIDKKKNKYYIAFLLVDYRLQGRGYGRILLTKAIEMLKKAGAKKLEISVNRFNLPAQALYKSVGFAVKDVYEGFLNLEMVL